MTIVARRLRSVWIAVLPIALWMVAVGIDVHASGGLGLLLSLALGASALWTLFAMKGVRTRVIVDEDAVRIGERRIAADVIEGAWLRSGEPELILAADGITRLRFESDAEARHVLEKIRAIASARSFPLARAFVSRGLWTRFSLVAVIAFFGGAMIVLKALEAFALVLGMLLPPPRRVVVGDDGVLVVGWLRRSFVPWSRVQRVSWSASGCTLARSDGGTLTFRVPAESRDGVKAALALAQGTARQRPAPHELPRPSGTLADWSRALRGESDAPYREGAMSHDALLALAEDPDVSAPLRVAAAAAAAPALSPEERDRVRLAAASTASPSAQLALARIATGLDEAALDEALAEAEREERAGR